MATQYPAKVAVALKRLESVGVSEFSKAPPLHRSLWRIGIAVPPPLVAGFYFNFAFMGLMFAAGWAVCMAVFFVVAGNAAPADLLPVLGAASAGSGILFGFAMAYYFRSVASKHGLPAWTSIE